MGLADGMAWERDYGVDKHGPLTKPRPTVAEQQCGAEEKLQMVRDVVTTWNYCAWVTDRDALIAILSLVGDNNQP